LKENCADLKQKEVISKLCCDSSWAAIYPNMSTLAKICRVVPIQTADVERTFSQLKLIKTRVRNRMNEKTLDSLLRIAIEGPPISEFPVTETVKLWATKSTTVNLTFSIVYYVYCACMHYYKLEYDDNTIAA
jgi:hypothetical protein